MSISLKLFALFLSASTISIPSNAAARNVVRHPMPAHERVQTRTSRGTSPHRTGVVRRSGVRIHYLEWGKGSRTIVLLPGYSLTAHVFDAVGAALARDHRVIAITPRGFGESDAPADSSSYTIATLVDDVRAVLDSLHVDRAALVGHSLSGSVVAAFALRFPARVEQIVLLDSFPYEASAGGDSVMALDSVTPPPFRGDTTYDAVGRYLARYRYVPWNAAFDADLRVKPLGSEGARRRELTQLYISDQWASPPDVSLLKVPALEICAVPSASSEYPWLKPNDPDYRRAERYVKRTYRPFTEVLCSRFASTVPGGRVERLPGSHYLFFTRPEDTVRALRRFIH